MACETIVTISVDTDACDVCRYLSQQTNTAAGLFQARNTVLANTARNRAGVDDVILLITDGNANIDSVRYGLPLHVTLALMHMYMYLYHFRECNVYLSLSDVTASGRTPSSFRTMACASSLSASPIASTRKECAI